MSVGCGEFESGVVNSSLVMDARIARRTTADGRAQCALLLLMDARNAPSYSAMSKMGKGGAGDALALHPARIGTSAPILALGWLLGA